MGIDIRNVGGIVIAGRIEIFAPAIFKDHSQRAFEGLNLQMETNGASRRRRATSLHRREARADRTRNRRRSGIFRRASGPSIKAQIGEGSILAPMQDGGGGNRALTL
jgi:hypothetical protein